MKKRLFILLSFLLLFTLAGCSSMNTKKKPDIRGEINKLNLNDKNEVVGIFVEGKIEEDTSHDKASIDFAKDIKIYYAENNTKASIKDLKEGMKVEVIFTGPVRESYPVQATAEIIRIIK
jgi:beta-N-acetylhexosaminidase